jgi:prophage antirepressor-like protein
MQELQIFNYESKEVRTVEINGEIFWVAKDVCDILGYANVSDACQTHCKGIANSYPLQTAGGIQDLRIINEPDLFRLIIKSTLPAAEKFENWVFTEVLPSIRKTGSYTVANNSPMPDIKHLNKKIDSMSEEIKSFKKLLSENKKPKTFEEIKSFFNVIDYSKKQQYIVVEYSGSLFSVNNNNNYTISIKEKMEDGIWENNWSFVENQLGSLKKGLEYILEMY